MAAKKKMDLLTAVELILEKAQGTGLSSEFYRKADRYIKYVADKMKLTKEQSVMMALFIDNSSDSCISISDFCKYLDCRTTRILRYMSDIDVLEKRELVRCCRESNSVTYRVPMEVVEAFKKDELYVPKDYSGLSCQELFAELDDIFSLRKSKELKYEATVEKIRHLFNCNNQLLFVQKVKSYGFCEVDGMMLVLFSHLFVNKNDDNIKFYDIEFLNDQRGLKSIWKMQFNKGCHILFKENLIEFNNEDGFENRESMRMTSEAKRELFSELSLSSINRDSNLGGLVKSEDIVPKRLFFGKNFGSQITELGKLLEEEQYKEVHSRMKETGFRCGFTCLFYGSAGTGKTETVLQLARQTGRDILQVNISQIKSKWVGESEKNIKQVFDHYRAMVKENNIAPILLFNEADAVIGRRQESVERAVDKMENSIQNIILQEMETLDGILIATTNLAQNMDKAFERRFLYKIKFEKPTVENRISMWREMIPVLKEEDARMLADKYDFSGGQIENIARHYTIGNILHGDSGNIVEELSAYCDNEKLEAGTRKIGFCM